MILVQKRCVNLIRIRSLVFQIPLIGVMWLIKGTWINTFMDIPRPTHETDTANKVTWITKSL